MGGSPKIHECESKGNGAGEMALWVKSLLYNHEDLSLDPKHSSKKQGVVEHESNLSARR